MNTTKNYDWTTQRAGADVQVSDANMTYYATIPDGASYGDIAREFIRRYDFGDEPHEDVTFTVTTLADDADDESVSFQGRCTNENGIGGELI